MAFLRAKLLACDRSSARPVLVCRHQLYAIF
jgi:hypothetical protein